MKTENRSNWKRMRGEIDDFRIEVIHKKAVKMANDETEWEKYLEWSIFLYLDEYDNFLKNNFKIIKKVFKNENNEISKESRDFFFNKLEFLQDGVSLLNKDSGINKEKFDIYKKIESKEKILQWSYLSFKVEKELNLEGFQEINDLLQKVITFYKNNKFRESLFEHFLETKDFSNKSKDSIYKNDSELYFNKENKYTFAT